MFKKTALTLLFSLVAINQAVASGPGGPLPCKYNDDDGTPRSLYKRVQTSPDDWYSHFKQVQICDRPGGKGSYVLIQEELIKNFNVLNPARSVLSVQSDQAGNVTYKIADDIDQVVLNISADGSQMEASGHGLGDDYTARLQLVWSAR